jgi:hypothetical protein
MERLRNNRSCLPFGAVIESVTTRRSAVSKPAFVRGALNPMPTVEGIAVLHPVRSILASLAAGLVLAMPPALAADQPSPQNWDGLVQVDSKKLDAVFLMPGEDFRPYTKVIIDPAEVAFKKNWMRDINSQRRGVSGQVTQEDAEEIMAAARTNFADVFAEEFRKGGYTVVQTPGPDVLRLRPGIFDLYITAPDTMSPGRTRTFTVEAGEATLIIEVRDSTTLALLGRAVDRRSTRNSGSLTYTNSVTNLADFRDLFRQWARITVSGLNHLKELSPVPADLEPGQKSR